MVCDLKAKFAIMVLIPLGGALCSCGPQLKEWEPEKQSDKVYSMAINQTAPQPVYNRLRDVYLPDPLPSREMPVSIADRIDPVFTLDVTNTKLEDVAKILAQSRAYSSYCASSVADRKITLKTIGTVDELAQAVSRTANVDIVIDEMNRQIRVLSGVEMGSRQYEPSFER